MRVKICCCCHNEERKLRIDNANKDVVLTVIDQPLPASKGNSKTKFVLECLEEHNRLRALHRCPPLKLNRNLCDYASEWAETLADRNMLLEYRSETKYGENLFVAREYDVDAQSVVKCWYDEIWLYNFSKPGYTHGVDHFTQLIWMDTKELGVGIKKSGGNTWIVVNYEPKGNIIGQFEENVPKPLK